MDSEGNVIAFYLNNKRDTKEAKSFFKKALASSHGTNLHMITIDGAKAYLVTLSELKQEKTYHKMCQYKSKNI
ncbi:DDE-type integrase/transposase/recombinase [Bacillus cereus group sp. Bc256]|uniref:DDE-type integrase/transposase/recombinase n=1 Tax=Bacillus cereus group sp. Bc256 TaxID=3018102 RepID=UPI003FA48FB8